MIGGPALPLPFSLIGRFSYETPEQAVARTVGYLIEPTSGRTYVLLKRAAARVLVNTATGEGVSATGTSNLIPVKQVSTVKVAVNGSVPMGMLLLRYIAGKRIQGETLIKADNTFLNDFKNACKMLLDCWKNPATTVEDCQRAAAQIAGVDYPGCDTPELDYHAYEVEHWLKDIECLESLGYKDFYIIIHP